MNVRRIVYLLTAIALATVGIIVVVANITSQPIKTVASSASIPSYCLPFTPPDKVATCQSFHAQMQQYGAQHWPSTGAIEPANQIIAQQLGAASSSFRSNIAGEYPAQMTYAAAMHYMGWSQTEGIEPSTPVWIVTYQLKQPIPVPSGILPTRAYTNFTTNMYDAINGAGMGSCVGCDIVQSNGSLIANNVRSIPVSSVPTTAGASSASG